MDEQTYQGRRPSQDRTPPVSAQVAPPPIPSSHIHSREPWLPAVNHTQTAPAWSWLHLMHQVWVSPDDFMSHVYEAKHLAEVVRLCMHT